MKLKIAKDLWRCSKEKSESREYRRIAKICYKAFVIECIIKCETKFKIKFNNIPNELLLFFILDKCNLRQTAEHIKVNKIVYDVKIY